MLQGKASAHNHGFGGAIGAVAAAAVMVGGCFEFGSDRSAEENKRKAGNAERGYTGGSFRGDYDYDDDGYSGDDGDDGSSAWFPSNSGSSSSTGSGTGGSSSTVLPTKEWTYSISYPSVILSPGGEYLVATAPVPGPDQGWPEQGLVVVVHRMADGVQRTFPTLVNPRRLNFSRDGNLLFVLDQAGEWIHEIHLGVMTELDSYPVLGTPTVLDVSPDGRFLVTSEIVTSDFEEMLVLTECSLSGRCELGIVDRTTGGSVGYSSPRPIRDLDFSTTNPGELIVTSFTYTADGAPEAHAAFVNAATGQTVADVAMPNCADELVLQPGGRLALLSPVACRTRPTPQGPGGSHDPISILDTLERRFVVNLPGFGPVAMSADGSRAVGFTRRDDMISQWGYAQKEMVGLISVELPSLAWTVIEYGPEEPTYVLADGGRKILAHDASLMACDWSWSSTTCEETVRPISIFDLEKRTRRQLEGPSVTLERFSSDEAGRTFWFPDGLGDVVKVDVNAGVSERLARRWPGSPELLSRFGLRRGKTPATHPLLVLGEDDQPIFYVLKPFGTETIEVTIQPPL